MNKLASIINLSIVLRRGSLNESDCDYFGSMNHPKLIAALISYLNLHASLLGLTHVEDRQSIADNGCDVFVELYGKYKVGIQVKSPQDVAQKDFAMKVKAQYADSHALGLDKFYILICCPLTTTNENKINYLLSQLATYKKYNYHAILGPQHCIRIFDPGTLIPQSEFDFYKQFYSEVDDQTKFDEILKLLKADAGNKSIPRSDLSSAVSNAINRATFQPITTAIKFADYMQVHGKSEEPHLINGINDYLQALGKLSPELRGLYHFMLKESQPSPSSMDGITVDLHEIGSLLGMQPGQLAPKIKILDSAKYGLVQIDEDSGSALDMNFWKEDWNLPLFVKDFCEQNGIELKDIIVDGDFSLLN